MAQEKLRSDHNVAEASKLNQNNDLQSLAFYFLLASVHLGTIAVFSFTGLLISMLCSLAATIGTITASIFVVPLVAAGEFISIFIAFVAAIYVIPFAVTAAIVLPVIAPVITLGWIGVIYSAWMGTRKGLKLAEKLWSMTGSDSSSPKSRKIKGKRRKNTKNKPNGQTDVMVM